MVNRTVPMLVLFSVLNTLCLIPSIATAALILNFPKLDWVLEIGGDKEFVIEYKVLEDERTYFLANDPDTALIVSAYIEDAKSKGNSKVCRDFYWDRIKDDPLKQDIRFFEREDISLLEYMIKDEINQKHVNAYLVKDDKWIDIHISKVLYEESDRKFFDAILDNIYFNYNYHSQISSISYSLPDEYILKLNIPKKWMNLKNILSHQPTITLHSENEKEFFTQFSVMYNYKDKPITMNIDELRQKAEISGMKFLERAMETKLKIYELNGKNVHGYYYILRDKQLNPEYRTLVQGFLTLNDKLMLFTILHNLKSNSDVITKTLQIFADAEINSVE